VLDALQASLRVAGSGLAVQSARLRVVAENIANAQSTGNAPGAAPYQRKTITFENALDQASGIDLVQVKDIGADLATPFQVEHDPGNPAADADGNVKMPNVNMISEMSDMREANRSYEANLQVIKQSRDLISMTIDLLKGSS
jgi:flagellar basal-body rod protein FlgC